MAYSSQRHATTRRQHNKNSSSNNNNNGAVFLMSVVIVVIVISPKSTCISNINTECKMSEKWWGKYYQSGLGDIIISENHMTTKGICINQTKDFYVFFNREEDCFYCLVMLRMHRNILQYRESHCVRSRLHNICSHVQLETPMHTMVRENADAIKCPLNGAYLFNINDPLREPCSHLDSIARPCVGRTRYQMLLKSCKHGFEIQNGELHMDCIGTWKEGSDIYLYVRLSREGFHKPDDTYRCLRYQGTDLEVWAAMSADATCQGLRSSSDGPYVLRLLRNNNSTPDDSCQFPNWLDDVTWFDNKKNVKIRLDKEAGILTEYKRFIFESSMRFSSPMPKWSSYEQSTELRCLNTDDEESDEFLAIVGKNHKCDVETQCLKLSKHTKTVFSAAKSNLDKMTSDISDCLKIRYGLRHVFFADHIFSTTTICSSPGVYYSNQDEDCPMKVSIGCHGETRILMDRTCEGQRDLFDCTTSWTDKRKSFIVAKKLGVGSLHCFVFGSDSRLLHFNENCSGHADQRVGSTFPIFEPCHGANPPYMHFTPSSAGRESALPDDDEDAGEPSGFEGLDRPTLEGKREKHIYLTNGNSLVTVEGVWEVKNMNWGLKPPGNRGHAPTPAARLAILLIFGYLHICN